MKNSLFDIGRIAKAIVQEIKIKKLYMDYKHYTMVPYPSFRDNIKLILNYNLPKGDIVECGVWKGGMIASIAKILGNNRHYYLFDSFEGLPLVKDIDGKAAYEWQKNNTFNNCIISEDFAQQAMKKSRINNYKIIKGYFENTLKDTEIKEVALLRLDADWYDSTMICLKELFPKVTNNGLIIIDDYYHWDGCSKAVHDFLSKYKLPHKIRCTRNGVAYIIK